MTAPLMLDLFSGLGGASQAFKAAGWRVITVDNEARFNPDVCADISTFTWRGERPAFVWASPPCTYFSRKSMRCWYPDEPEPSTALAWHARSIIFETRPLFWAVENVRGAVRYLDPIFGRFTHHAGPFFLWSNLPPFRVTVPYFKQHVKNNKNRAANRAKVPETLSLAILRAIVMSEL